MVSGLEEEGGGGEGWRRSLEEEVGGGLVEFGSNIVFLSFFSHIFGSFKKMKLTYLYSFKL